MISTISPNERLQYRMHPWTSFVIVPLFALANAGIHLYGSLLHDAVRSPVTIGVLAVYVVGKPLGIMFASWLGTRSFHGGARLTVTWPGLAGTGAVAGIGFTVSLLIASLAFTGGLLDQVKLDVLAAVVVSSLEAVMNSLRNGLGMTKTAYCGGPSQPDNPHPDAVFPQVHNTL